MSDHLLTDVVDHVLTIRFNRPAKRNALTLGMYSGMADALNTASGNASIRAVLITGSPDCFSAGNDLVEGHIDGLQGPHGRFMKALMEFPKPVVAAPCGIAVGVGVTMLLHCDLVYCGADTTFRIPFVPLAVCPEFGSSLLLPRLMGHLRASEILLTGQAFSASAALEYGLVNDVLPNAQVEEYARAKATFVAAQPPVSVRTTKMLLKRACASAATTAIKVEMDHLLTLQDGAEAREAIAAFQEKRRADFSRFS